MDKNEKLALDYYDAYVDIYNFQTKNKKELFNIFIKSIKKFKYPKEDIECFDILYNLLKENN